MMTYKPIYCLFAKQMVEGRKDMNKKIAMKVEIPNSKTEAVI